MRQRLGLERLPEQGEDGYESEGTEAPPPHSGGGSRTPRFVGDRTASPPPPSRLPLLLFVFCWGPWAPGAILALGPFLPLAQIMAHGPCPIFPTVA